MALKKSLVVIISILLVGCNGSDSSPQQPTSLEPQQPDIPDPQPHPDPDPDPDPDSDNDGLSDTTELNYGLDPNDPSDGYYADNDGDLIINGLEIANNLNLNDSGDANYDNDLDGLSNLEELFIEQAVFEYNAEQDGAFLDNGWTIHSASVSPDKTDEGDIVTYEFIATEGMERQTLRDLSTSNNPYFKNTIRIPEYIEHLYREGGEYSYTASFYGNGAFFALQVPASDNFTNSRLLIGAGFSKSGDNDLSLSIRDYKTIIVPDGWNNGKLTEFKYIFSGENSFKGNIYVNGTIVAELDNLFTSSDDFKDGLYYASGSKGNNSRGYDVSNISLKIGDAQTTNPNLKDTDFDGIDDNIEIEYGLDPIKNNDGYHVDTDGDGVSNGVEIDNGLNPLDGGDQIGLDSDNDGFSNEQEIELGSDPFYYNAPNADDDHDGLTNEVEFEYRLNPNDPTDGYEADTDGDGAINGEEIANEENPNDHMLMVKDRFTIPLLVFDTNDDGVVNEDDNKMDVTLERYSLRKTGAEAWVFDESHPDIYYPMNVMPEVRSFRGRIDDIHDASVYATVWPNCTISYDVFFGYTAMPDHILSADAEYYKAFDYPFENDGVCKNKGVSDARYQRGLQADYETVEYAADASEEHENYWPAQGNDFHLFERPQSHQSSFYSFNRAAGQLDPLRMYAFMEYHVNLADQFTTRTFFERLSLTDMLIEVSGKGSLDDGSTAVDWDDNWSKTRNEFWSPRRNDRYWYEHVYWNKPNGSTGVTYGERMQNSPGQGNQGTFTHEMGHNFGSGHEAYGERYGGYNAMRSSHSTTQSSIVHQGEAIERRRNSKRSGVQMHYDLRVPASDWNIPPLAQPDHASTYRDQPITIDVMENDSDPNNETMSVLSVHINEALSSAGANESELEVQGDGTIYFNPPTGFIGMIDAFYVLTDQSDYTSRGILHINVEHNGISDVFTFDSECETINNYEVQFPYTSGDAGISVKNWGYKNRYKDENGTDVQVSCDKHNSIQGANMAEGDKGVTWSAVQFPFYGDQVTGGGGSKNHSHPHLFEINDKDFSLSFWFKPDSSKDMSTYSELARRGRKGINGWDIDGWVIGSTGDTLNIQIHEKSKLARNSVLKLDIPDLPELVDSDNWVQVAISLSWGKRELVAYVNGDVVGTVAIPDNFELVSTSGTGHTYGRGAYAVFGQATIAEGGTYSTVENGGVDDIVVAHKALSTTKMKDLYQQKLPAFGAIPLNGKSVDIESLSRLKWRKHTNLNMQLKHYNVYLSTDENLVAASDPQVQLTSSLLNGDQANISEYGLSGDNVYYWKVEIVLLDNSVIDGEVWSIWEKSDFQAFSLERAHKVDNHLEEPVQGDYKNDISLDRNYEFNNYHPNDMKILPNYDMSYIEYYSNNYN